MHNKTIAVLGAGYGGITAALRLARLLKKMPQYRIYLIDRNPFHTFKTQLHEAAVRNVEVSVPVQNIIRKTSIVFIQDSIREINTAKSKIILSDSEIGYEYLVIALGSITNYYNIPGLQEYSLSLQSLEDANAIYEHINGVCEEALLSTREDIRQDMLRFVIGGGGLTGVELAGELADLLNKKAEIASAGFQILLIEGGSRLVPNLDERMSEEVSQRLQGKGVKIITNCRIVKRTIDAIALSNGDILKAYTLVWTGGIKAGSIIESSGLTTGQMGRIIVNEFLQAEGHPFVYALGDNALAINPTTGNPVPAAAQFALQQGRLVAGNIYADICGRDKRPYKPKVLGEIVSLGRHLAVGWLAVPFFKKVRFFGFIASLLKTAIEDKHILLLKKESRNWIDWRG